MDIKKENIGLRVYSKRLKSLVILSETTKSIFMNEGRFDLFENTGENDLKPKKKRKPKSKKNDLPGEIVS